jgi:hypothetical protein
MGAGPRIHTNNLALGFDTGRTTVDNNTFSYSNFLGEPTVNYTSDSASQGGWGGNFSVLDSSKKKFKLTVNNFNGSAGSGQGWRAFTWDLRAYAGQSVTISATVKVPDLSPGTFAWIMMGQTNTHTSNASGAGMYLGYSAASERVQKSTTTTEHITWSGTLGNSGTASQPSGHVGFTLWYNGGTSGIDSYVEVSNVQIELKSHETPFTTGSRGNTSSLFDITNSTNIDLTNASFSSNAQPDLDGTGDYFQTTTSCGITGDITLEAVFNEEAGTSPHTTIICTDSDHAKGVKLMSYKNSDRYGLWLGFGGTTSYVAMVTGTLSNNTVYHLVGTWEQASGIVKIYLNGSLTGTISTSQTSAVVLNTGKVTVGADYHGLTNSYGVNGQVYVGRVYNKVLEASEVTTNYEAYKNRFNLS